MLLLVVVLLVVWLPSLEGRTENWIVTALCAATVVPLLAASVRYPRARTVWGPVTAAAVLATLFFGLFLFPPPSSDQRGFAAAVRPVIEIVMTASAIAAVAVGGCGMVRLARPLLSFAPSRPVVRIALPLLLLGASSLALADARLYPDGRGVFGHVAPTVPVLVAMGGLVWGVRGLRPLTATGRSVEVRCALAFAALLVCTLIGTYVDYAAFWAVPGVVSLVMVAAAAMHPSAALAGTPIGFRPVVEGLRFRWAGWAIVPSAAPIFAVQLGLSPRVGLASAAVFVLVVAQFDRDVRFGARPLRLRPTDRVATVARALPDALVHARFEMAYQPIVAVECGTVVGYEALLRWKHPDLGAVPPPEIVRAARWAGLEEELECLVVELVCRQLPVVAATVGPDEPPLGSDSLPYLSVNLQPHTLQQPGFADRLLARLAAAGCTVEGLVVEIVEDGGIRAWDPLRANVAVLRAAGIRIALDDFGTGSSNLRNLAEIDVDIVKLDRSLVRWASEGGGAATVRRLVDVGRSAGAVVVAEGAEDARTVEILRTIGVEIVQGYYFGRPASLEAALAAQVTPGPWEPRLVGR